MSIFTKVMVVISILAILQNVHIKSTYRVADINTIEFAADFFILW